MLKLIINLLLMFIFFGSTLAQGGKETNTVKKRDPFVDLVDASGRIKTEDEWFESSQRVIPTNIILKGIIWDEKRPLAIINGKIYGEGATISDGVVLEKINIGSVILKTQDNQSIKIELRKKEKK